MGSEVEAQWYRTAKGTPAVNQEVFENLDIMAEELNELGVGVSFCHVLRADNVEADELANAALDE